jgi:SAM-dependent methyltransferase
MDQAEFDKFAEEYQAIHQANIRSSGEGPEFFAEYKIKDTAVLARKYSLTCHPRILDFGAGVGNSIPYFRKNFESADLTCLDVSEKSLDLARERFSSQVNYKTFDGVTLPFDADTFDIVFTACVFHHIPYQEHVSLLSQLYEILRPGGILVIFEHNPFNPLTVRAVDSCEFDENAVLISAKLMKKRMREAGITSSNSRYRIFFPGLLRMLRPLEAFLWWLPLGAQYYVVANK